MDRRQFLKTALKTTVEAAVVLGTVGGGVWLYYDKFLKSDYTSAKDVPEQPPLDVPVFEPVHELPDLPEAEGWDVARVQTLFDEAIKKSAETAEEVTVELPHGEIVIDGQIQFSIPANAKINVVGHELGSRLRLHPSRSELSKDWGEFATKTLLYVPDMQGELSLSNIQFHGGSERAGVKGYTPPPSPWDAVVMVVGAGEGDKYDPAMHRAGKREGKVTVEDCTLHKSESEGILVQNLASAHFDNITGKNLDVLINSTWCDDLRVTGARGERFASDGFYITSNQDVALDNCQIKTARQAYDLQGVREAVLTNCRAYDAGKGWEVTGSETDKMTVSGKVTLQDCHSDGCVQVYSLGGVEQFTAVNGRHAAVGKWREKYYQREFLHGDGIVRPHDLARTDTPIVIYDFASKEGKVLPARKKLKFENVHIQVWKESAGGHQAIVTDKLPDLPGITYSRMKQ